MCVNCSLAICLQGIAIPPSCSGGYPFELEVGIMSTALGVWIIALSTTCTRVADTGSRSLFRGGVVASIARGAIAASLIMYPIASTVAMKLLNCEYVELATSVLDSFDGARSLASQDSQNQRGTTRISVLHSNPYFACWASDGAHTRTAAFAIAVLVVYSLGVPCMLFFRASRDSWLHNKLYSTTSVQGPSRAVGTSATPGKEYCAAATAPLCRGCKSLRHASDRQLPHMLDPLAEGLVHVIYRPG